VPLQATIWAWLATVTNSGFCQGYALGKTGRRDETGDLEGSHLVSQMVSETN